MAGSLVSLARRSARGLWWFLNGSRRLAFNLVWLGLLAAAVWVLWNRGTPSLAPKTALVLKLQGPLVDQTSGSARGSALAQLQGRGSVQTRLRDVLAVLEAAAKDEQVTHAVLILDDFSGAGLANLHEVALALERFKASGKKVVAWGSAYNQRQYYLAAHATEVWMHPMGMVQAEGFGRYRNYYKDALDRLGVSANVVRAGKYKNAAETFAANGPSAETLESDTALYGSLWKSWTGAVEKARKLPAGSIDTHINSLPGSLQAVQGDAAKLMLDWKLVDALKTRDEMRAALIERGAKDEQHKSFKQVSMGEYLARITPKTSGDGVGVIVAQGEIMDGTAPAGVVGGESTAELVRKAREDDKIKAVVLRVNSPGGSAFASELVRRELELTRLAGKPVVVSMGDVAASGGYWISLASDEIIADEGTVTGSIGVIGLLPSAKGALDKLSVHTAGAPGTTWLANAGDPRLAPDPRMNTLVQTIIDRVYTDFLARAATQRKSTPQQIDAVAQGRVWTGAQAKDKGLIDRVGSFTEALASARKLAKLPEDARVKYFEVGTGRLQQLLQRFGVSLELDPGGVLAQTPGLQALGWVAPPVLDGLVGDMAWLAGVARRSSPYAAAVHCLCEQP
jgi:protease IV